LGVPPPVPTLLCASGAGGRVRSRLRPWSDEDLAHDREGELLGARDTFEPAEVRDCSAQLVALRAAGLIDGIDVLRNTPSASSTTR
jgi:hypothetical protein